MVRQKNILVVDDDDAIRETLRVALEYHGYRVFVAAHGKAAIEVLPTVPRPCVILLDLMMPVMDGWEFMDALSKNPDLADIPVVVLSAFEEKTKPIRAKEIIKKPIDLTTLYTAVERYCDGV